MNTNTYVQTRILHITEFTCIDVDVCQSDQIYQIKIYYIPKPGGGILKSKHMLWNCQFELKCVSFITVQSVLSV